MGGAVKIETATVYRGARRRWFSLDAACKDLAWSVVNKLLERDGYTTNPRTPREEAEFYPNPERLHRAAHFLAKLYKISALA